MTKNFTDLYNYFIEKEYSKEYAKYKAHMIMGLLHNMYIDTINFSYSKTNGEMRIANGTLNNEIIPLQLNENAEVDNIDASAKTQKTTPINIIRYWDVDKNAWRSFNVENLTTILYNSK